jgi:hypothetical protein
VTTTEAYIAWMNAYVAKHQYVRGKCDSATKEMCEAFPELRRAAGFVYCTWGRDQHWWCVTPDGLIVDPTATQFECVYEYEEIDLSDPEQTKRIPTGCCHDCGEDVYEGADFCDDTCKQRTLAYLNSGRF